MSLLRFLSRIYNQLLSREPIVLRTIPLPQSIQCNFVIVMTVVSPYELM